MVMRHQVCFSIAYRSAKTLRKVTKRHSIYALEHLPARECSYPDLGVPSTICTIHQNFNDSQLDVARLVLHLSCFARAAFTDQQRFGTMSHQWCVVSSFTSTVRHRSYSRATAYLKATAISIVTHRHLAANSRPLYLQPIWRL